MSAFKKIDPKDIYLSSHLSKKRWEISEFDFSTYKITLETFTSGSDELKWKSIKHLYYSNFQNGLYESGSYENYLQTTLPEHSTRETPTDVTLLSMPRDIIGDGIEPGTLQIVGANVTLMDNGEGKLVDQTISYGDIIYTHGIVVIDNLKLVTGIDSPISVNFNSRHPIYTWNIHCKVFSSEMNSTLNPSAHVDGGYVEPIKSTPEFQPYITTVGLYNDSNELIMVGKLGRPTPKSQNTDMTFVVRKDI